jgi:putative endonuclease
MYIYIGITSNLKKRLIVHNSGSSVHTPKFKPWKLIAYVAFSEYSRALEFERYLKHTVSPFNMPNTNNLIVL